MTSVDWILLSLVLVSMAVGLWRGLVFEVLSLLGWIAAFFSCAVVLALGGCLFAFAGDV